MEPGRTAAAIMAAISLVTPAAAATYVDYEVSVQGHGQATLGIPPAQHPGETDWQGRFSFVFDIAALQNGSVSLGGPPGETVNLSIGPTSMTAFIGGPETYQINLTTAQPPAAFGDFSTGAIAGSSFSYTVNQPSFAAAISGRVVSISTSFSGNPPPGGVGARVIGGAVPEPASWMLMIGGFGLMGEVLRRANRGRAVATT